MRSWPPSSTERRPARANTSRFPCLPYERVHYEALFIEGGRADVDDDQRFRTRAGRFANSDSLYRDVAEILATRTTGEWLTFCAEQGIPATAAASLDQLVADLPLADHPTVGSYRVIPTAERFSATPIPPPRPAPTVGRDGRELLSEIGYGSQRIDELQDDGIIGSS